MTTRQTIKAIIARLAGAPLATRAAAADPQRGLRARPAAEPQAADSDPPRRVRTSRQRDGDEGEAIARHYLEREGLVFVAANIRYRDGELDLVMRDPRVGGAGTATLVFVEVRRRARNSHGGAAASITAEKRRRVVAAASHYLVGLGLRALPTCRFDVVTLEGDPQRDWRVEWLRDAFREGGSVLP